MGKGEIITTINEISFYYGGWNENGWHLVYTYNENFHIKHDISKMPTSEDCRKIFYNYYE